MSEIRVACPGCSAKMKLLASVEQVRCPRCDHLFEAAENRLQATSGKRSPRAARSRDEWEEADEWGESQGRDSDRSQRTSSQKKSASSRNKAKTSNPENIVQLRKFGGTMIFFGVLAFVLPLIGLQIKGLHMMSPEAQEMGGLCFFILGSVVLGISYLGNLGGVFESGFKVVKWGVFGLFGLLVGGIALLVVINVLLNTFRKAPSFPPDMQQVAQQQEDQIRRAQELHQHNLEQMRMHAQQIPENRSLASALPSAGATNPASANTPNTNPQKHATLTPTGRRSRSASETTEANSANAATKTEENPFQEADATVPGEATLSPFVESTPTASDSANVGKNTPQPEQPGMRPPVRPTQGGQATVRVVATGFEPRDMIRKTRDLREAAQTFRMRVITMEPNNAQLEFDGVDSAQAFADRIGFATVKSVDAATNTITISP